MNFSVDANLLLYAVNQDAVHHVRAKGFIEEKARSSETWIFPWQVAHAFLRISTHSGILPHPLALAQAVLVLERFLGLSHVRFVAEGERFWEYYKTAVLTGHIRGGAISDALIAAILKEQGVSTLFSADRDFLKFKGLRVINPLE
ncbi:MAG: TA system VapC family ribonuclease toxin [Fibrobacterota bacterium]